MIGFILQSLTFLLLAGVLCYAVFIWEWAKRRKLMRQVLLGIIFGALVILLGMNSFLLEPLGAPFDAKSGPLLFAGYLGGPLGALIAGICGALFRLSLGGPSPFLGVFMNLAIPAVGLAVSFLRPPRNLQVTHVSTIGIILVGFALLHLVPFWYLSTFGQGADRVSEAAVTAIAFTTIGSLSILVTWQILNYAVRFANEANRSAELVKQLDLAMRASGMGMFDHHIANSEVHFDAGMISIYGLDRAPGLVPQAEWEALIHPDDRSRVRDEMQKAWKSGNGMDGMDFRVIRQDGSQRDIRASWVIERDADGMAKRVTGVHSDLTNILEAERQHKVSQGRLEVIVENLPGVIFENVSSDREVPDLAYITPKCKDIWGYSVEEFFADPSLFRQMHDPEDLPIFLQAQITSVETGKPMYHRYRITARDGQSRWLDYHGGTSIENGRMRIKGIVLDVTHEVEVQKQMEKEREISLRAQKNESVGQLTGGVAHDFNNLLAVILGSLELLDDDNEPSVQKELIETAKLATLRGADLTKNMLAFARQAPLNPEVLDLNNVVREARNWIGRTLPESVMVETSLLAGVWPIEADRTSLESALLNLILNARDAMEGYGKLTIETANVRIDDAYVDSRLEEIVPGRYVMLAVSDTGSGISEDNLGSIFEPFFTTKPPGVGSGLGLAMTVGFMRQSGGTVQVYTEIGEGTTFKLYFPVAMTSTETPDDRLISGATAAGGGRRLLVAEDEDAVRNTLVTILERAGYHVTATATGDAAFAAFEADPNFEVLLTDIVMPGKLQGTHLAKVLREKWPDLPVLFMSGYASEATVHGNGLRPEDIRLMKPVQRAELLSAIGKVVTTLQG